MDLSSTRRVPFGWAVAAGAVMAAGGLLLFGLFVLGGSGGPGPGTPAGVAAASPDAAGRSPAAVTTVATVVRAVPRYARPGQRGHGVVPASWWGRPSVLPVLAARPGWVRVRLAQRPNGSTAWLPASDVRLGVTPYRIVIDVAAMHLNLYEHGRLVLSAPAGVGAADDPTPPGEYFAAFDEPPSGPGYGPFIMVTSAHSPALADWSGSGDAIIGIHGPLGEDARIGAAGGRVSHGCVRLHLATLARLAHVPPGTPIDIISKGVPGA